MHRLMLIILVIFTLPHRISGQDQPDFKQINTETYRLYLQQEWDSLLRVGKEALKMDIDYYYLRMRMGIACYSKKNYRKAEVHFKKALSWNQGDPGALEYLYYSRLFSGQKNQSLLARKSFRGDLATKLPPVRGKFIETIGLEYLYSGALNGHLLSEASDLFNGLPPGFQYITRHLSNASLSSNHRLAPGIVVMHAYTFLAKTNHYYYDDGLYRFNLSDQRLLQHQYYISPQFTIPSGLTLMPAFHLVHLRYQVPIQITSGYQGGNPLVTMDYMKNTDYITGVGMIQAIHSWDLHMGIYYSQLNRSERLQGRVGLTWYPKGNLNLYTGAYLNSQYIMNGEAGEWKVVPELMLGFSVRQKVWIDLTGTFGELENYLENNGLIVYNGFADLITGKSNLTVSIPVTESGSMLYIGGRWTSNRSDFNPFEPGLNADLKSINYQAISIYGGVSWKF